MKKQWIAVTLGTVLLQMPAAYGTTQIQDFSALESTVNVFVHASGEANARYEVNIDAPDARLQLPLCAEPLQVFLPPGHRLLGSTLIGVRCNTNQSWVIYVSTHIKQFRKVVMLDNAVTRGTRINPRDLVLRELDIGKLTTGYFVETDMVAGKLAKRSLTPGIVVTPAHLSVPRWVSRGDIVTLLIDTGGLQVRAQGEAMADGAENDKIKARNILSGKVVDGIVAGPGMLRIRM